MEVKTPYRLAAVDIDDTLVGHDKLIGPANRAAIERLKAAGIRVVLASGRRHGNMIRYAELLNLGDFVVSAQGAMTKHAVTQEVIHYEPLPRPLADELIALGKERECGRVIFTPEGAFSDAATPWTEKLRHDTGGDLVYVDTLPPAGSKTVEKVLWCDDPAKLRAMWEALRTRYEGPTSDGKPRALVTITDPHLLEFTSPAATKASGLAAVAWHYGIEQQMTLAFGDGNNDVSMLGWAGLGVAMSHASESVKQAADRVAPPGDPESSFARAVEALLGG